MECNYKSRDGRLVFKVTGESAKDIFKQLGTIQEIFDSEFSCGICETTNIQFRVRTDDKKHEYYELHCQNKKCRARLAFGQHLTGGTLFVKRKDADNNYLEHGGWERYDPNRR